MRQFGFRWVRIPPGSPDMNPIETCWKNIKQTLFDADGFPPFIEKRNEFVLRWHNAVAKWNRKGMNDFGPLSLKRRVTDILAVDGAKSKW